MLHLLSVQKVVDLAYTLAGVAKLLQLSVAFQALQTAPRLLSGADDALVMALSLLAC